MTALLQMRDARSSDLSKGGYWLLLVPVLAWLSASTLLFEVGLVVMGIALMVVTVVLPLHWASRDASIFLSLRKGRCLQEVLSTPSSAWELTDGVARHSAARAVRFVLPYVPALYLMSLLACPTAYGSLTVAALLWAPGTYLVTFGTSYLIQQLVVWSSEGRSSLLSRVAEPATGVMIMLPAGVFVLVSLVGLMVGNLALAAVFFLGYLLLMVGLARAMVVAGLEKLPGFEVQSHRRFFSARSNRFVRSWSENAIVARECAREAHRIPFGWFGWLLWKRPVALFAALVVMTVPGALSPHPALLEGFFWILTCTIILVQWTRAVMRTQAAYVSEVEQSTVDTLTQTPISGREYLDGWMSVGSHQLFLENLVVLPVLAVVGWMGQVPFWMLLLALAVLLAMPFSGALLGVWASLARNRAVAHGRLVSLAWAGLAAGGLLWLFVGLMWGISLPLVQPLLIGQFLLTLLSVAAFCRLDALATLDS